LSTTNRKHYNPEEKVVILKKHLIEQVPVSTICDEYHLQPTVFYRWQKEFFEYGAAAFQRQGRRPQGDRQARRIEELEAKLRRKNEVLSELMEEHVQLKKELGEL
jgi:transposase-like protein